MKVKQIQLAQREREKWCYWMDHYMKEIGRTINLMEMDAINFQMGPFTKASFLTAQNQAKESIHSIMVQYTMDNL